MSRYLHTTGRSLIMDHLAHRLTARFWKRLMIIALAFCFSTALALEFIRFASPEQLPSISIINDLHETIRDWEEPRYPLCDRNNRTFSHKLWTAAESKYKDLRDDKFTIVMQTYRRPDELNNTLHAILDHDVPSLLEVVIVWNDLENNPPKDFKSPHGVPVRYRASPKNSLNQKLWPDPTYKTKALLLSDDDVYYHPKDLEFAFHAWKDFGQRRMTGALARCAMPNQHGNWDYSFCSKDKDQDFYSMILTNLAFSHISFLEYYSSQDTTMTKVRAYIDKHFNCEDIAMNYMISRITGTGPLLVTGHQEYVNYVPKQGISTKPGHLKARSQCMNDFTELFSCMPLVNETGRIQRGVVIL